MRTLPKNLVLLAVAVVLVTVAALTVSSWLGVWHPESSDDTVDVNS